MSRFLRHARERAGDEVDAARRRGGASDSRAPVGGRRPARCSMARRRVRRRGRRARRHGSPSASEIARRRARESRVALTLAQAVLKGDKMDDVVRDAVMMGVAAIQPIVTARSEVTLAPARARRAAANAGTVSPSRRPSSAAAPSCRRSQPHRLRDGASSLAAMPLPGPALMFVEPAVSADAVSLSDLDEHHRARRRYSSDRKAVGRRKKLKPGQRIRGS